MDRLIEIHLAGSIIIYTHNKENLRLDSQTIENSKKTEPEPGIGRAQVPPPGQDLSAGARAQVPPPGQDPKATP